MEEITHIKMQGQPLGCPNCKNDSFRITKFGANVVIACYKCEENIMNLPLNEEEPRTQN